MTFYCPIEQEMLNFVTNCCKLLKVNQAAERAVSSTVYQNETNGKQTVGLHCLPRCPDLSVQKLRVITVHHNLFITLLLVFNF